MPLRCFLVAHFRKVQSYFLEEVEVGPGMCHYSASEERIYGVDYQCSLTDIEDYVAVKLKLSFSAGVCPARE